MVNEKLFREDLYYRLNAFPINVPPLRQRKVDIPLLLDHFIKEFAEANGMIEPQLTPAAINYLSGYDWPGNVRQLRNFVERLMIMKQGDIIDLHVVRLLLDGEETFSILSSNEQKPLYKARDQFERHYILNVLNLNEWRVAKAAEILGMDRANLYRKMRQLEIDLAKPEE